MSFLRSGPQSKIFVHTETSGSHGGEYEDYSIMEYSAMYSR
jgi:hypothetical protein